MPLYEYQCTACHKRTEKIQKFSDPELTTCPHCSGKLERTLTAPAVQFKGSGWYKDLYSSAKPATNSSETTPAASTPGSDTSAAKSDSASSTPAAAPAATAAASASSSTKS